MRKWFAQYGLMILLCAAVVVLASNVVATQLMAMTGRQLTLPFTLAWQASGGQLQVLGSIFYFDGDLAVNVISGIKVTIQNFRDAIQYTVMQF